MNTPYPIPQRATKGKRRQAPSLGGAQKLAQTNARDMGTPHSQVVFAHPVLNKTPSAGKG